MTLIYGGVELPTIPLYLRAIVERYISTADVYETSAADWPGPRRQSWPFPPRQNLRPVKLGSLFWPRDASRHAVAHFLAGDEELAAIRRLAYQGIGRYRPLPLVLQEDCSGQIETDLYLLPPRPLQSVSGAEGLWLLTIVDERFFWPERVADIVVFEGTTTWADLLGAIATGLEITLDVDAIADAYLLPPAALTAHYESLPMLLDAVCRCIGHRFVRGLDGTNNTYTPGTAAYWQTKQLTAFGKMAGGTFAFATTNPSDLQALVPASVLVAFPMSDGSSYHAVTTTLTSLALREYQGKTGHAGTRVFHDSATYDGTNAAELAALAQQISRDYYRWQLGRQDTKFAGIVPYEPEGLNESVEWILREGEVSTRVQRGQWDDREEELLHRGSKGAIVQIAPGLFTASGPAGATNVKGGLLTTEPITLQGTVTTTAGVIASSLPPPPPPTVTTIGAAGSTTYIYKITAVTGAGETLVSTGATISTGNATLTTNNANVITIDQTGADPGIVTYNIYRDTSGGTPSSTGLIGTVTKDPGAATISLTDTGLTATGTTPTVNTSGVSSLNLVTGINVIGLTTPGAPTVTTVGTAGATSDTYKVVAVDGSGTTIASSGTTITTSNATLTSSNYNLITLAGPVSGAISYQIYRTAAGGTPSTTGLIGTIAATGPLELADTGLTGDGTTAPVVDTTGQIIQGGVPIAADGIVKGWVYFSSTGGTITVLKSYNITSVVRNGTGDYTITFDADFDSANYVVNGLAFTTTAPLGVFPSTIAAGSVRVKTYNLVATLTDADGVMLSFHGVLA